MTASNIETNPLLLSENLVDGAIVLSPFSTFHVEHIVPAIEHVLAENRAEIERLVKLEEPVTWTNFIKPMEVLFNRLDRAWGPIGHLDAVNNNDAWHEAYTTCLTKITDYGTFIGQHAGLFAKYKAMKALKEFEDFSPAQKKVIENALQVFTLSGIDLPADKQDELKAISQELSQLGSQFSNNVLKSTQAWERLMDNEADLAGLSDSSKGLLKQLAKQKDLSGWRVTLDYPSYSAIMMFADNRELRESVYRAFATRASDQADDTSFDNQENIDKLLALRHQKAQLLGFKSFSDLSLAKKMAKSTEQVMGFLTDLAKQSTPQAKTELATLADYAKQKLGLTDLQPWDVAYCSEKLQDETLSLSQETLKPYFPVTKVLEGLFTITRTLFNVEVKEKQGVDTWHRDVRYFELFEPFATAPIAGFYLDLYARENKRGGAWMDSAITRWETPNGELQIPVAYLVCNFTPPVGNETACLTHSEVTTLFHEFGHGLQHMLTLMVDYDVSGIAGVPWDAVELPSQFMENYCWEKPSLDLMTCHTETGDVLPDDLLASLKKSRGFQSAMMMVRQLEFSLFDFSLHAHYTPEAPKNVLDVAQQIREQVAVIMPPSYHRFPHSFSHIFAGGYAAGYYSYKWAEVLSADAFSLFTLIGIMNTAAGHSFKQTFLSSGGSVDPMALFKQFRGREPEVEALLRQSGIGKFENEAAKLEEKSEAELREMLAEMGVEQPNFAKAK